jgi:uncharacterized membrane protein
MASKYDTNPLDPDFPKKAAHAAQEAGPQRVQPIAGDNGAETRPFASAATEDATRRYDAANFAQYASPYQQPPQQAAGGNMYQAPKLAEIERPSNRKIASVGLPENILMVLPYAPFYIGFVAGILELVLVPQSETKVRFHAAQGLAAHAAIFIVTVALGIIGEFSSWANTGSKIFGLVTMIFLIITMIRIWRGNAVHIEAVDGLTNWISDKIKPQIK